jgi:hypothetical protein
MEVNYGNTRTTLIDFSNTVITNCNIHGLLSKSRAKNVLGEKVQYKLLSNFTEVSLFNAKHMVSFTNLTGFLESQQQRNVNAHVMYKILI